MKEVKQDPAATVTYYSDWSSHLSALPYPDTTIASATVSADWGASVTNTTAVDHGALFTLSVANSPLGSKVTVTVTANLSNGDTDIRRHGIVVQKT